MGVICLQKRIACSTRTRAKGARALIEVGFEKVDEFDGKHIYRKRIDSTP